VLFRSYDFSFIYGDPDDSGGSALFGRSALIDDVMTVFGGPQTGIFGVPSVAAKFGTSAYPNPFNPVTKISYTIKSAGHLTLKIYNVRGQLVKTVLDEMVEQEGSVSWDGTNSQGSAVSSGVYFYEARMGNEVKVNKLALVK